MWLVGGGGNGGGLTGMKTFLRHFSRKTAPNLRKINPKVPQQDASSVAEALYGIIKHQGPLTVSNTWIHAKEAGINGLHSKTHMKLMLKWMRGRNMLKQLCNHAGSGKKFLLSALPDGSDIHQPKKDSIEYLFKSEKPKAAGV